MIHPDTELRKADDDIGVGVFVTRFIPRGTLVWVQDPGDVIITPEQLARLGPAERAITEKYAYGDSSGNQVLCGDIGRYMNHSCDPATLSLGEHCEIAARDLKPGDELTCEYGYLNLEHPMRCLCGAPACRLWIRPDDLERHGAEWSARVRALLPALARTRQPLWPLVQDLGEESALLEAIRRGDPGLLEAGARQAGR